MENKKSVPDSVWVYVKCPVCNYSLCEEVYISKQETGSFLGRINIRIVVCDVCGFVYQNPQLSENILKEYYSTSNMASGSVYHDKDENSTHSIRQSERANFFKKCIGKISCSISRKKILEIGCSTGDFLMTLGLEGWILSGIEPSIYAAKEASKQGLLVDNSTLQDAEICAEDYEAICVFSVIEHLPNLNHVFKKIHAALKPGGMLCLEVPDTMMPVPQLAEFFGYEHLWHFTKTTLINYLSKWGHYDVVFDEGVNDSRLRACAVKLSDSSVDECLQNDKDSVISVLQRYTKNKNYLAGILKKKLEKQVSDWKVNNKKIAIYGAGIHTHYLLNLANIYDEIDMLLDNDPNKFGSKYRKWIINNESAISKKLVNCIIISSKAYEDEIYRRLLPYAETLDLSIMRCYSN